jgi:hypothetical protein
MTDMIKADEAVLKTDKLGRVKTPPARREHLLEEFERSGLSGVKFAELAGIKYQTLATWLKKRRQQRGITVPPGGMPVKRPEPVRWLEAVVEQAQGSGRQNPRAVILQLPGGVRLEITDAQQVELAVLLLRALPKPC